jgi:heme-degrading monooxygenase HmoA
VIREVAQIPVKSDLHAEFEAALADATAKILPRVVGFIEFVNVGWCWERPDVYMFTIDWETLEAHEVGFRQSEQFTEWRTIIGPYFDGPAVVEHFSL